MERRVLLLLSRYLDSSFVAKLRALEGFIIGPSKTMETTELGHELAMATRNRIAFYARFIALIFQFEFETQPKITENYYSLLC